MDFFGARRQAQQKSRWLLLLFIAATGAIIGCFYLALCLVLHFKTGASPHGGPMIQWHPALFVLTAAMVGGPIAAASLLKTLSLQRQGGAAVARDLGGRRISRNTEVAQEQRIINIVDEIAIAAGTPSVPVFVLNDETDINAFTAGDTLHDAVIGVTRGALTHLSRDELQTLVAHEFGHILNGDMRLNFRLIGVLHGILLIHLLGDSIFRTSTAGFKALDKESQPGDFMLPLAVIALPLIVIAIIFAATGIALTVIGSIGHLLARLIKAAICRQNEYHADAAAVEFTRNPDALTGLLTKVAAKGSFIRHPLAEGASHLFIAPSRSDWLAVPTHPPLLKRIKRIRPTFDERLLPSRVPHIPAEFQDEAPLKPARPSATATPIDNPVDYADRLLAGLPGDILHAVRQTAGASQCLLALLLSPETQVRTRQADRIRQIREEEFLNTVVRYADSIAALGPRYRLPVLDLALPTLAELAFNEKRQLMSLCNALIQADDQTSVFEQIVRRLMRARLLQTAHRPSSRVDDPLLAQDITTLLATLIAPESEPAQQQSAFREAIRQIHINSPMEWPTTSPDVASLNDALDRLANSAPELREQILDACVTTVTYDRKISPAEAELMRAIAQALDCPTPPSLYYAGSI